MLGPQHAAAMYEIERQCFPLPWSEEQCAAAFGQKAFSALGMFRHEALIGYISVYHTLDELEILNLAVLPMNVAEATGGVYWAWSCALRVKWL